MAETIREKAVRAWAQEESVTVSFYGNTKEPDEGRIKYIDTVENHLCLVKEGEAKRNKYCFRDISDIRFVDKAVEDEGALLNDLTEAYAKLLVRVVELEVRSGRTADDPASYKPKVKEVLMTSWMTGRHVKAEFGDGEVCYGRVLAVDTFHNSFVFIRDGDKNRRHHTIGDLGKMSVSDMVISDNAPDAAKETMGRKDFEIRVLRKLVKRFQNDLTERKCTCNDHSEPLCYRCGMISNIDSELSAIAENG